MPEDKIEEYLRSLENLEDQDDSDEKPEINAKELGYALRQEKKGRKAVDKELEELRKFREEIVAEKRQSVLKDAGLNDFHARAYLKFYPEVSEENLAAYKLEAGLEMPDPEETPEPVPVPEVIRGGFAPTTAGSPAGGRRMLEAEEYRAMMKNPASRSEAIRAAAEGRVKLHNPEAEGVVVTDTAGLFNRG